MAGKISIPGSGPSPTRARSTPVTLHKLRPPLNLGVQLDNVQNSEAVRGDDIESQAVADAIKRSVSAPVEPVADTDHGFDPSNRATASPTSLRATELGELNALSELANMRASDLSHLPPVDDDAPVDNEDDDVGDGALVKKNKKDVEEGVPSQKKTHPWQTDEVDIAFQATIWAMQQGQSKKQVLFYKANAAFRKLVRPTTRNATLRCFAKRSHKTCLPTGTSSMLHQVLLEHVLS
jgi:hypothetical protein